MADSQSHDANGEVERIERLTREFRPTIAGLTSSLSSHLIALYRERRLPWDDMIRLAQMAVETAIEEMARDAVIKIICATASRQHESTTGRVKKVVHNEDESVDIAIRIPAITPSAGHRLWDLTGKSIPLPLVDVERWADERPITVQRVTAVPDLLSGMVDLETGEVTEAVPNGEESPVGGAEPPVETETQTGGRRRRRRSDAAAAPEA